MGSSPIDDWFYYHEEFLAGKKLWINLPFTVVKSMRFSFGFLKNSPTAYQKLQFHLTSVYPNFIYPPLLGGYLQYFVYTSLWMSFLSHQKTSSNHPFTSPLSSFPHRKRTFTDQLFFWCCMRVVIAYSYRRTHNLIPILFYPLR